MTLNSSQKALIKKASNLLKISVNNDFYFGDIKNINDACYWILRNAIEKKSIKKIAYPNESGGIEIKNQYDIKKWLNIVYKIYAMHKEKDLPILNLLDQANIFFKNDEEEYINFKSWFKYYYNGENLKYSSGDKYMKKQALYTGNLQGTSGYSHSTYDLPGSSFSSAANHGLESAQDNKVTENTSESEKLKLWKRKINTAIRRIDQLLRSSDNISPDDFLTLSRLILDFSDKINRVQLISTAEDLAYQFGNSLLKHSKNLNNKIVKTASDIIIKTAQEAERTDAQAVPAATADTAQAQEPVAPAANTDVPQQPAGEPSISVPKPDDVDPADITKIKPIPGAKEGEYDNILGDVNLDDAATKLDEVAGMLSDRRIIRLLAEFDIMLDKIGIAAMFPELAEAQSKLIDGYSYALTRVTKMMGQLANARMLLEAQDEGQTLTPEQSAGIKPEVPVSENPQE